jgi:hypothetical protein
VFLVEKHSVATVIQSVNQTGVYTTGQQQYRQPAPGSGQPAASYGQPSDPPPPLTCSTISNIPYNLIFTTKFNDSMILITIISSDYLNLSLTDKHVGDVTIPTQIIEYDNKFFLAD